MKSAPPHPLTLDRVLASDLHLFFPTELGFERSNEFPNNIRLRSSSLLGKCF
jgi:hypothetical protein